MSESIEWIGILIRNRGYFLIKVDGGAKMYKRDPPYSQSGVPLPSL